MATTVPLDPAVPAATTSLERELADVLRAANLRGRQARAVSARLGSDDAGARTLAHAGACEGYSRERVRQLEARPREHGHRSALQLPVTEAAPRLVEAEAPIAGDRVAYELAPAGLSTTPFGHYLSRAPVVQTLARGRYALRGQPAALGWQVAA